MVAGALLRLLLFRMHPYFSGDALMYGELARNMLAHHVFGFTEGIVRPTLIRLPGYPLFLAACFLVFGKSNYLAVIWVQATIDLVSCLLLGGLSWRLQGRRAGVTAVWLAALCPFTANYSAVVLTEALSLFCVVLGFFRWSDGMRAGGAGRGELNGRLQPDVRYRLRCCCGPMRACWLRRSFR